MGSGAFCGSGLTEAVLHPDLDQVPSAVFCGCVNLEKVVLPENLISIGDDAFGKIEEYDEYYNLISKACTSLRHIELPESLEYIGSEAFNGSAIEGDLIDDTGVKVLEIPARVQNIGYDAFSECNNICAVKILGSYPFYMYRSFDMFTPLYVHPDALDAYKTAEYWSEYTILPYDMMSVSLGLSVILGTDVAYSDGYFNAPLTVTVTGDETKLTNVYEYGYYVKTTDRWGDAEIEYYPIDALNVPLETTLTIYSENASCDYENHKATGNVVLGSYIRLVDETVVTYSNTPVEVVYDKKPSVKFTDVTTSVDGSVNFELIYEVEGAYWIYNEQLNKEGNGYFSMSSVYIEDGVNTTSGSWNVYETPADGYIYFSYCDRNYVDYTSNFVHLSMDADSVVSAEIVDSME